MLVVDPWHWLDKDGSFLFQNPLLNRRMLRIARFIEYGGPLERNETRETLVDCTRRPKRKQCLGLMWVVKTEDDGILAHCMACGNEEAYVPNWQATECGQRHDGASAREDRRAAYDALKRRARNFLVAVWPESGPKAKTRGASRRGNLASWLWLRG